jgi:hypothetical protein
VRCANLTDDELWRAIAENTNSMSALIREQLEFDSGVGSANDPDSRKKSRSVLQTIDKYQREYRDFAAELRRRYPAATVSPTSRGEEQRLAAHTG